MRRPSNRVTDAASSLTWQLHDLDDDHAQAGRPGTGTPGRPETALFVHHGDAPHPSPRLRRALHPSRALKPPSGPDWVHEVKHDGYRLIVRRDGETVRLFTRRGYDWTERYPAIAAAVARASHGNPTRVLVERPPGAWEFVGLRHGETDACSPRGNGERRHLTAGCDFPSVAPLLQALRPGMQSTSPEATVLASLLAGVSERGSHPQHGMVALPVEGQAGQLGPETK
jgi:ATP dependent DNA ligase domain